MTPGAERHELKPLLRMAAITKDFAGGRVLFGVDFSLHQGEVHALVGQNGAGKSTLMKILGGVYADYGGAIEIRGKPVSLHDPRTALAEAIAIIYQEFMLVPPLSVAENILLGREPRRWWRGLVDHGQVVAEARREAMKFGISLPLEKRVASLGVATQQLVEIVKAVSRNAEILVMDEPTARLSGQEKTRLFSIIREVAARGVGVVYISHFLEEVFQIAERVTVLRDGRVIERTETANLDLRALTQLVAGARPRDALARHTVSRAPNAPIALRVANFGVPGRVGPVDLELRSGEIVGLAGLVGSGRTTLARALVGLNANASGSVEVPGWSGLPRDPAHAATLGILLLPEDRKREGVILQRPIAENVALTALRRAWSRHGVVLGRKRQSIVREMIGRLGIVPDEPKVAAATLSGGNQQKVVFARAMAAGARVLILDQPTAGVDVGAKADLYSQIGRLAQQGVALLLITDDLEELLHLCDRIVVMRRGVPEPPVEAEVFDRPQLLHAITTAGNSALKGAS